MTPARRRGLAVAAVTGLAALGGARCEREKQPAGIGPYHVKRLTLAKAPGRCDPTELPDGRQGAWCYGQPRLGVAGMNADVDLYFGTNEPDARVIEIQLQIRGCDEEKLASWIKSNFGAPHEERPGRAYWQNAHVYVIGELPSTPGRCMVRVLPRSEHAEYERLRQPAPPPPPPGP